MPSTATRRIDGKPETPADARFLDLRESGYHGWIDQNGYPVAEIERYCSVCRKTVDHSHDHTGDPW